MTSLAKEEIEMNAIVDDRTIENDPVALLVENNTRIMRFNENKD